MIRNKSSVIFVVYFIFVFNSVIGLCPRGYFKIPSMKYCHPWLRCKDIHDLKIIKLIGYGSTKNVYLAEWRNFNVSVSKLKNLNFQHDFYNGLHILKSLGPNRYLTQLVGFCELLSVIVTEYHEYNNALNFQFIKDGIKLKQKIDLCINYVEIVNYLHNSPIGTLVNCDSNDLMKLLSQLLITSDLNIILGDVDALPEVSSNSTIKCGRREIKSSFVAPEQLWKNSEPFQIEKMDGYNEKIDIWKIPDVCNYFLDGPEFELLQYRLFSIHLKCKDSDPNNRPSAKQLLDLYKNIKTDLVF